MEFTSEFKQDISKKYEDDSGIVYSVGCSCGSDEHRMDVSFDLSLGVMDVNFFKTLDSTSQYEHKFSLHDACDVIPFGDKVFKWCGENFLFAFKIVDFFGECIWRLKQCFTVLIFGNIKLGAEVAIHDEKNVTNFVNMINEGYSKINKREDLNGKS